MFAPPSNPTVHRLISNTAQFCCCGDTNSSVLSKDRTQIGREKRLEVGYVLNPITSLGVVVAARIALRFNLLCAVNERDDSLQLWIVT